MSALPPTEAEASWSAPASTDTQATWVGPSVEEPAALPQPPQPHEPRRSTGATLRMLRDEAFAWCRTLVSAGVYATLIVTFGFQVARVEGKSMQPTLDNEDRLIVNKFAYVIGDPRPGDIVMMFYPADPDKSFVKRVIAEAGDTVKIADGVVYVNGVELADDFVLPSYRSHDDHDPVVVRDGFYYVLGDHRNNSADSREFGEVPKKYIVGKVQLRWWPLQTVRIF